MTTKKYKHLFFDLDHTLWDFDGNSEATMQQLYREFELEAQGVDNFNEMFSRFNEHNDRLWEKYRTGIIKRDELRWKRMHYMLLDYKIGDTALAHEMSSAFLEILPTRTLLMPFAKEILEYCRAQGYEMHLITNGFETTQRMKLQYSGIARYFDQLVTSERCNAMKPHKDIFDFALGTTRAKKHESIMIGDAIDVDIFGAINAGWDTVFYNPKNVTHNRIPTYEVESLEELLTIF